MSDVYKGIPTRVRVGSHWFKVEIGGRDDHESGGTFGFMDSLTQKISVRPGMTAQNLANTFIHECIHAMNWVSRAGATADGYSEIEEDFTCKIANGLCAFMQDNPKAMEWFARLNSLDYQDEKPIKAKKAANV